MGGLRRAQTTRPVEAKDHTRFCDSTKNLGPSRMVGSTRETTTLILNDFKRQGIIEFLGRKIVIRKKAGLDQIFQGG